MRSLAILFFIGFAVAVILTASNWNRVFLAIISGAFGFFLKGAPLGFTCTFRSLIFGDFIDISHLLLMLILSTGLVQIIKHIPGISPLFDSEAAFATPTSTVGLSLALGSFTFGMGMQLASGCASGTLVGMGSGLVKSWIVIWFFIAGATAAVWDPIYDWYTALPATESAITIEWYYTILILFALFVIFVTIEVRKVRKQVTQTTTAFSLRDAQNLMTIGYDTDRDEANKPGYQLKRPWLWISDLLIAIPVALFFLCEGYNIGIMASFPAIGTRVVSWFGIDVKRWHYWKKITFPDDLMRVDLFLSDIAIVLGAFVAATFFVNFGRNQKNSVADFLKAILGGLFMGIGGRMAGGCNIGAMLAGINLSSISGFVWWAGALCGSTVVALGEWLTSKKGGSYTAVE
jgi:uncharacterized membrane protein YedE/YeeE